VWSENPPGDDGLELNGGIFHDFNTGGVGGGKPWRSWRYRWRATAVGWARPPCSVCVLKPAPLPGHGCCAAHRIPHCAAGVYLLRYSNRTAAWTHAWRAFFPDCTMHDQHCAYELMRKATPAAQRHPQDPRLQGGWDGQLWLGIVPSRCVAASRRASMQRRRPAKSPPPRLYPCPPCWALSPLGVVTEAP
jgi:hypothetical protein